MALTEAQWADIHAAWISSDKPIREIAREFGAAEATIRKRSNKEGWGPRNAPARKRAIVDAALAGARSSTQCAPRTEVEESIHSSAEQAISDMLLAASVGRAILLRCRYLLELFQKQEGNNDLPDLTKPYLSDPKDLKATSDAARGAMETIRRSLGLDAPPPPPPPEASKIEQLATSLERARQDRI